jgi:hypothetical protein
MRYNGLRIAWMCGADGLSRQEEWRMTDIAESASPVEAAEARRVEVDEFLVRVRETVARTREVIQATQERLGPAPGAAEAVVPAPEE